MKRNAGSRLTAGLPLALAVTVAASLASAHGGAKGVVKERMDLMKDMADAMKAMGPMFKGEAPFDASVVARSARHLAEHAEAIPKLTPAGSDDPPSEALPAIWRDWDGYVDDAERLASEGAALLAIAENGADPAEARSQFARVAKTCSNCHDSFRKPKD